MNALSHPVVVVGAGPAGLAAAATLAQYGVAALLLERRVQGSPFPRATVLSMRTMELLRSWGLEQAVLEGADDVEMTLREIPTAARAGEGRSFQVGYASRAQSEVLSPTAAACVAQDHLEAVLLDHLAGQATVTVRRGVEVLSARAVPHGTTLTVREASDGRMHNLEAAYVVATDGAHSAVRRSLGIAMSTPREELSGTTIEFRAPLWDVVGPHRHVVYTVTDPVGAGVFVPAGQGDRWLYGGFADQVDAGDHDAVRRQIRAAAGVPDLPVEVTRVNRYSTAAQVADRFSAHRVFLAGDAAHRVTPRGGTGLNTAVAGARDLAWKLGWVSRGWAAEPLLATYEAERRPPAVHNLTRSDDPMGSRREVLGELQVDLGGRLPHAWLPGPADLPRRSTLDLVGPGLSLLTGPVSTPWHRAAEGGDHTVPLAVHPLPALTARAVGIAEQGAILIRPDGAPVAQWPNGARADARLREGLSAVTDPPPTSARRHDSAA